MLLTGSGASLAQTTAEPAALKTVTVRAKVETPDSLPAAAPGSRVATGARLGVLGNVGVMDAPFNVTAYTAEGIADMQAQTVGAVLRSDPSVRATTNEGHLVENFNVRGLSVSASSLAINGVYGLAPEQSTPTEMFERVELIKGPGAMLMGMPPSGDVGGIINLVPKRAGDTALTRLTTTVSSKSNLAVHLDLARRFGEEQRLGVRVNGLLSGGETWLDKQTKARKLGAIALDYRGSTWSAEADVYSLDNRVRKGVTMQPIIAGWTTVPKAPHGSTNFFYGESVFSNTSTQGLILRGRAELNAGMSVFASAGSAKHQYDGFIFGTRPVWLPANAASGNASGTVYNSWGEYETRSAELGLRAQFNTGAIAHQVTLATSWLGYEGGSRKNGTGAILNSNIFNPSPITMPPGGAASSFTQSNDDVMTAISLVDTLFFVDGKLQLTLGARSQQVEQKLAKYKQRALTPLLGLVAKPWGESVSLYGNYVEGLSAGTTVGTGYVNEGETFAPYRTEQIETGVKWVAGSLTQTVSLFQISKPALIVENNRQQLDGEQRNRGVEWHVFGQLNPALTLQGGVAYTKAQQTRTAKGVNQGKAQLGVPSLTVNLGGDWRLAALPGLTLSAQLNHTGAQWLSADNSLKLPAWTTLDAGLRYATQLANLPTVWRVSVSNLADKAYFDSAWGAGRVNVGAPRAVRLSAALDF